MYRLRDYLHDRRRLIVSILLTELAFSFLVENLVPRNLNLVAWLSAAASLLITIAAFFGDYRRQAKMLKEAKHCLSADSRSLQDIDLGRRDAETWAAFITEALASADTETEKIKQDRKETERAIEAWVHDIKTPLSTANLLLESYSEDDLSALREALFFLNRRVNQVLYYAKSENITSDLSLRRISLADLISSGLADMAPYLVSNDVKIKKENLDTDIICDPKWLEFVLQNLWENAVKYAGPGVTISLHTETDPNGTSLYVADDGPGIPEFEENFIFRRGFTGEINRQHTRSTGMGLSLAKTLCDRMRIKLDLIPTSQTGKKGATFRLYFPRESWFDLKENN